VRIYQLTQLGKRLARTTNNPDTPNWKLLHYLDSVSYATADQLSMAGMSENEAMGAIGILKRKGLVEER